MHVSIMEAELHLAASRVVIADSIAALDLLVRIAREQRGASALDVEAWMARPHSPPANANP